MADNNDLINTLMSVLGNDGAKEKLMETIGALTSPNDSETPSDNNNLGENDSSDVPKSISKPSLPIDTGMFSKENVDMVMKIKNMMDRFNNNDDNRIVLLNAIKPYMKPTRLKNIDLAVNFIKLINFSTGFKGF